MALPNLDYSQIDYSVDLNPLAAQYGVARDDLAEERDKYWQGAEAKFRAANPGAHVAEDSLGAIAQMQGKAPLTQNDAQGNNSSVAYTAPPADAWNSQIQQTTGATTNNQPTPGPGLTPSLPVTGTVPAPAADPTTGSIGTATPAQRHSALYDQLLQRIQQPITPDPNDPTIRRQADAYSAATTRATRESLANLAEHAGPYANLTGETRLANERAGQAAGGFEAQLIGREQDARRESIKSDLALYGNLMSDEEKMQLAEELGLLSEATQRRGQDIASATSKYSTDKDYDAVLRRLGLDEWIANDKSNYQWYGGGS